MWIKLDDGFATHPKILRAGIEATVLQIRALCYASHNKTDGFIPNQAVVMMVTDLELCMDGWPARMIEVGLWERVDNLGYQIHDYLHWNISKSAFEVMKDKLSRAGRKGMKSRWNKEKSDITKVITQVTNQPCKVTSTATATLNPLNSPNSPDPEFERFWEVYPKKKGKIAAQVAWKKAKGKPALSDLLEAVQVARLTDDWRKEDGKYIPHPATWLNQGCWDDQPCELKGHSNGSKIPPFPGPEDPIGRGQWRLAYGNDPAHPKPRG